MSCALPPYRLLLIHEDATLADRIDGRLGRARFPAHSLAHLTHLADALTYLRINPVDLVLVGTTPGKDDPAAAVRAVCAACPEVPLIALIRERGPAIEAPLLEAGARECLPAGQTNPEIWRRTLEFCLKEAAIGRELATANARLDWLAHMDALTGLLNRKGLERALVRELAECRRQRADLTALLVDLDDFTRINATLGHGVGDLVLVAAARRIGESLREQDQVGRCGTDRFLVMMPGMSLSDAEVVAERIRLAIGRDVITAGQEVLATTASLGLTAIPPTSLSFDEVLAKAHFVLQRGKLKGKNRIARAASVQDPGMITQVEAGHELVRSLLRGKVLEVASQPIVNLADGRIVSREMLVRGPAGPLQSPDTLFRFCQEKDILAAVDLRCLKLCAAVAARLGPLARYHVNIMPATLLQTPVEELIRVLNGEGVTGRCCLELSEQQLLGDPSALAPRVAQLQAAGIHIAIDDVGCGSSCLEGLIMLQPQVIKVDKRLVKGVAADRRMQTTLHRLLRVAAVLGAEVVAEGIETPEDCRALVDSGVRLGQGYLFGMPQLCKEDRLFGPPPPSPPEPPRPDARA